MHTTLSPTNRDAAVAVLGPEARVLFVPFGVEPITPAAFPRSQALPPTRVLVVGNDRHRDWALLVRVAEKTPGLSFTVASKSFPRWAGDRGLPENIVVLERADRAALLRAYEATDLVFLPLTANLHASGITVALEASWAGRAIVAGDAGGLKTYFDGSAAKFYAVGDVDSAVETIQSALEELQGLSPGKQREFVAGAGLSGRDYALRHVILTSETLGRASERAAQSISSLEPPDPTSNR